MKSRLVQSSISKIWEVEVNDVVRYKGGRPTKGRLRRGAERGYGSSVTSRKTMRSGLTEGGVKSALCQS